MRRWTQIDSTQADHRQRSETAADRTAAKAWAMAGASLVTACARQIVIFFAWSGKKRWVRYRKCNDISCLGLSG